MKSAALLLIATFALIASACASRRPITQAPPVEPTETSTTKVAEPQPIASEAVEIAPEPVAAPAARGCPPPPTRVTINRICEKQLCPVPPPPTACVQTTDPVSQGEHSRTPLWEDFQSLISLGIGLNFIFGLFEALGERRLNSAQQRTISLLEWRKHGSGKAPNPAHYATATFLVNVMTGVRWIGDVLGVYISIAFAAVCIGLLIYATEHAKEAVSESRMWLYILPLGWPALAASAMLLFTPLAAVAKWFFNRAMKRGK